MLRSIIIFLLLGQPSVLALDYERFEQGGKVGIRDTEGHIVIPAAFDALGWSDGSFSVIGEITGYRKGMRWGLLNLKKEFITQPDYLDLTSAGGNYVIVRRELNSFTVKVGCINLKGEVIIPLQYDDLVIHDLHAIVMVKESTRYTYGLKDLTNRTLLPTTYSQITPLGTLRFAVKKFDGKTALFSEEGKWVTGFDIDSLSSFHDDLAIVYQGLHRGAIDRTGTIKIEPEFGELDIQESGRVRVRKADRWKVIDHNQKTLRQTEADDIAPVGTNRFRLTLNGKNGLIDSLFTILIPIQYDYIGPVQDELLVVGKSNRYGVMRTNADLVLPIQFDTIIRDNHLLHVRSMAYGRRAWDLYDTVGVRKTQTSYDAIGNQAAGMYPVFYKGFAGAIDKTGKERVACVYDSLLEIGEAAIGVRFKGLYGIVSREDVWRVMPQIRRALPLAPERYVEIDGALKTVKDYAGEVIYFTNNPFSVEGDHFLEKLPNGSQKTVSFQGIEIFRSVPPQAPAFTVVAKEEEHEGLRLVLKDGKYGFVDSRGRIRIANRYEGAGNFHEGLAAVKLLGKWGFIDKSDQIVVHPAYDRPADMKNGTAIVARNGKAGIIDKEGNIRLELRYDSITRIDMQTFIFYRGGFLGMADGNGRILLEPRFDSVSPIGDDRVIVSQGGKFGLLTRDGLSVFPLIYDKLIYQPATNTFFARESFAWETREVK